MARVEAADHREPLRGLRGRRAGVARAATIVDRHLRAPQDRPVGERQRRVDDTPVDGAGAGSEEACQVHDRGLGRGPDGDPMVLVASAEEDGHGGARTPRRYPRTMPDPASPTEGRAVLHLFLRTTAAADGAALAAAVKRAEADEIQVVPVAILGHKADVALMIVGPEWWRLRHLQTEVVAGGFELVDSYVSLTEVSEYAKGLPEEYVKSRLYPNLPPEGLRSWCFYPMSKGRAVGANWYTLDFDERNELMREHGGTGRKYRGRVVQLITGSTGLDEYEWGVTLFAKDPDDLKDVVYTMRFDRASACTPSSARSTPAPSARSTRCSTPSACRDRPGRGARARCSTRSASVVVAFSGGADSALLARVAHDVLGPERARIVTAVSPSLAPSEHADARHSPPSGAALVDRGDRRDGSMPPTAATTRLRCYHCKDALMDALEPIAAGRGRDRGAGRQRRRPG